MIVERRLLKQHVSSGDPQRRITRHVNWLTNSFIASKHRHQQTLSLIIITFTRRQTASAAEPPTCTKRSSGMLTCIAELYSKSYRHSHNNYDVTFYWLRRPRIWRCYVLYRIVLVTLVSSATKTDKTVSAAELKSSALLSEITIDKFEYTQCQTSTSKTIKYTIVIIWRFLFATLYCDRRHAKVKEVNLYILCTV